MTIWGDDTAEEIAIELRKRGNEWAEARAAAEMLEDNSSILLAKKALEARVADNGIGVSHAQLIARACTTYRDHMKLLGGARERAYRAKIAFDTYQNWIEMKRTEAATSRAEMNMR